MSSRKIYFSFSVLVLQSVVVAMGGDSDTWSPNDLDLKQTDQGDLQTMLGEDPATWSPTAQTEDILADLTDLEKQRLNTILQGDYDDALPFDFGDNFEPEWVDYTYDQEPLPDNFGESLDGLYEPELWSEYPEEQNGDWVENELYGQEYDLDFYDYYDYALDENIAENYEEREYYASDQLGPMVVDPLPFLEYGQDLAPPLEEVPKPLDPFYGADTLFEDEQQTIHGEQTQNDFYDGEFNDLDNNQQVFDEDYNYAYETLPDTSAEIETQSEGNDVRSQFENEFFNDEEWTTDEPFPDPDDLWDQVMADIDDQDPPQNTLDQGNNRGSTDGNLNLFPELKQQEINEQRVDDPSSVKMLVFTIGAFVVVVGMVWLCINRSNQEEQEERVKYRPSYGDESEMNSFNQRSPDRGAFEFTV